MLQHFKTCFRRFPWLGKIELIFPFYKTIELLAQILGVLLFAISCPAERSSSTSEHRWTTIGHVQLHILGGRHPACTLSYVSLGRTEKSCNSPPEGASWSEGLITVRSSSPIFHGKLSDNSYDLVFRMSRMYIRVKVVARGPGRTKLA